MIQRFAFAYALAATAVAALAVVPPAAAVCWARARASSSSADVIWVASPSAGSEALLAGPMPVFRMMIPCPHLRQVALLTSRTSLDSGILYTAPQLSQTTRMFYLGVSIMSL